MKNLKTKVLPQVRVDSLLYEQVEDLCNAKYAVFMRKLLVMAVEKKVSLSQLVTTNDYFQPKPCYKCRYRGRRIHGRDCNKCHASAMREARRRRLDTGQYRRLISD